MSSHRTKAKDQETNNLKSKAKKKEHAFAKPHRVTQAVQPFNRTDTRLPAVDLQKYGHDIKVVKH